MSVSPQVTVAPSMRFGRPAMKGVSTEAIADMFWAGEDAADEYDLTRHELLVALWFEGSQGQPRFRLRWKVWAERAGMVLWHGGTVDPAAVDLPSTVLD